MKSHQASLMDVIECSWWPNDGPVLLRPPATPFEYEDALAIVTFDFEGRAATSREGLLARVRELLADGQPRTTEAIAAAVRGDVEIVAKTLDWLSTNEEAEVLERHRNKTSLWRATSAANHEEAEAAE